MSRVLIIRWFFIIVSLGLVGCVSVSPKVEVGPVSSTVHLLQPSSYGGKLVAQQLMSVEYQQQQHRLRMILDITPQKVTLVGLTSLSVPVFRVSWDGVQLQSQSNIPNDAGIINAQQVMEDIMLALWPKSSLQPLLSQKGWILHVEEQNRYFTDVNQSIMMTITYTNHRQANGEIRVHYEDVDMGYRLKTLQWDTADE
ncbi:DUF3261 domain-containing protein [Vibrio sp. MA40-2]|uniref:DUF3261 domain-containing protein n=1 Tax=Vibrio sp. MA40-2 TaxID=3391828 RepID=UPI0039A4895D